MKNNFDIVNKGIFFLLLLINGFCYATVPPINNPSPYFICVDNSGEGLFYLESKNSEILNGLPPTDHTVTYHQTQADALAEMNPLASPYMSFSFQILWVRVEENATGDFATTTLDLIVNQTPEVNFSVPNLVVYENPSDGVAVFDLNAQYNLITYSVPNLFISYHLSVFDAQNQANAISNASAFTGNDLQTIYVTVHNGTGCIAFTSFVLRVFDPANVIVFPDANFKARLVSSNSSNFVANIGGNYVSIDTNGDGEIQFTEAAVIQTLDVSSATIADLTGIAYFTSLNKLRCDGNQIDALDLTGMPLLNDVSCSSNSITSLLVNGLTNLVKLDCHFNQISALNLSGLGALEEFRCDSNSLTFLDTTSLSSIKSIISSDNFFTSLSFTNLPTLEVLVCGNTTSMTTLTLNALPSLRELGVSGTNLGSLDLTQFSQLVFLNCDSAHLSSLNVTGLANLSYITAASNQLTSFNTSTLNSLKHLNCSINQLTGLDLSANSNLENLYCGQNDIPTLNVSNLTLLKDLDCQENNMTAITFGANTVLEQVNCGFNDLTAINTTTLPALRNFVCWNNQLTTLDVSQNAALQFVSCSDNLFTTLDFSTNINLTGITVLDNPNLETLFIKNGRNELNADSLLNCPNLMYICADEAQIAAINASNPSITVNTFCSFTPGGNFNTITGTVTYDFNNNGCDALDAPASFLGLNVNIDATPANSAVFTNNNGIYNLYTSFPGVYQLLPTFENPAYFTVSPVGIPQPVIDNSTTTHNICITANGNHPDIEVVLAPITPARPGFDATYEIVYRNKGNQTQSGTVTFTYNDSVLDFVSSGTAPSSQGTGTISWNYTNLYPFEHRSIGLVLNVNSPLETPAVNIGFLLNFSVNITPVTGDETPSDNTFTLNQTVLGSYDPNDITCLEGATLSPVEIGEYLHYVINFENTGNFYAENVVVQDIIDTAKYDMASLQVLNASHNMAARTNGNKVEFVFEGINLAAAAGNPPVGGHGNVLFKIKSKSSLVANDFVSKSAKIFFDYNAPITTNNAETTFVLLNNNVVIADNSIAVFPNPTNGILNITSDSSIVSYELYDVQGRILEKSFEVSDSIDLSNRQSGLYFLKLTSDKGSKIEKVVKK